MEGEFVEKSDASSGFDKTSQAIGNVASGAGWGWSKLSRAEHPHQLQLGNKLPSFRILPLKVEGTLHGTQRLSRIQRL